MGTNPPVHQPQFAPPSPLTYSDEQKFNVLANSSIRTAETLKRIEDKLYDFSRPVDEYVTIPAAAAPVNGIIIQPDYTVAEKYETILVSLPLGITSATLEIGTDRLIVLYAGAATTVQQIVALQGLQMIVDANDKRVLTYTGAATSTGWLELMGHVFSEGNPSL